MTSVEALFEHYLAAVERELRELPKDRRREIVGELSEHIAEAHAAGEIESEADARNLLERLGAPEDIGAEARERFGIERVEPGARETWAVVMLSIGSVVVPIAGWLVGVWLLWGSRIWTRAEKLIGTLIVPGGLGLPVFVLLRARLRECEVVGTVETCTGGASTLYEALVFAAFLGAIFTAGFLTIRRIGRGNAAADLRPHGFA
jgi:uncharacterized membrane protein